MVDTWDLLTSGQLVEAVIGAYTNVMSMFFYGIIIFIALGIIYMKTQNIGTVAITCLLIGGAILTVMPPEIVNLSYILMAFGITVIFYKLFRG